VTRIVTRTGAKNMGSWRKIPEPAGSVPGRQDWISIGTTPSHEAKVTRRKKPISEIFGRDITRSVWCAEVAVDMVFLLRPSPTNQVP
jgi:hypothetical protein